MPKPIKIWTARHSGDIDLLRTCLADPALHGWSEEDRPDAKHGKKCRVAWVDRVAISGISRVNYRTELGARTAISRFEGMREISDKVMRAGCRCSCCCRCHCCCRCYCCCCCCRRCCRCHYRRYGCSQSHVPLLSGRDREGPRALSPPRHARLRVGCTQLLPTDVAATRAARLVQGVRAPAARGDQKGQAQPHVHCQARRRLRGQRDCPPAPRAQHPALRRAYQACRRAVLRRVRAAAPRSSPAARARAFARVQLAG